jgi:hypothetical protein
MIGIIIARFRQTGIVTIVTTAGIPVTAPLTMRREMWKC